MITSIYYSCRFTKQLDLLLKSDRKGVLAAKQAEALIDEVRHNGGDIPITVSLKRTKHGERRVHNCEKYDLGSGYRLITLRNGDCLYIAFVGTHDECDLWFKKQRDMDFSRGLVHAETVFPKERGTENYRKDASLPQTNPEEDMYESELLNKIDDAILRSVFRGFCQKRI